MEQVVIVEWLDACTHEGWDDEDFGVVQHSIGWLHSEHEHGIRLARTFNDKDRTGEFLPEEMLDLPYGMIREITWLPCKTAI